MDIPPSPFKNRLKEKAVSGIDRKALSYLSALSGGALVKPPKMGGKLPKVQRSSLWCKNLGIETKEIKVTVGKDGRQYCYDYAAQQRVDCDEVDKHPREAGRLGAEGVEQEPPPQVEDRRRRPTPIEENEKEQIIYAIIEFIFSNYPEDENTETRKQEAYAYLDQFSLIKLRKIYQDLAKTTTKNIGYYRTKDDDELGRAVEPGPSPQSQQAPTPAPRPAPSQPQIDPVQPRQTPDPDRALQRQQEWQAPIQQAQSQQAQQNQQSQESQQAQSQQQTQAPRQQSNQQQPTETDESETHESESPSLEELDSQYNQLAAQLQSMQEQHRAYTNQEDYDLDEDARMLDEMSAVEERMGALSEAIHEARPPREIDPERQQAEQQEYLARLDRLAAQSDEEERQALEREKQAYENQIKITNTLAGIASVMPNSTFEPSLDNLTVTTEDGREISLFPESDYPNTVHLLFADPSEKNRYDVQSKPGEQRYRGSANLALIRTIRQMANEVGKNNINISYVAKKPTYQGEIDRPGHYESMFSKMGWRKIHEQWSTNDKGEERVFAVWAPGNKQKSFTFNPQEWYDLAMIWDTPHDAVNYYKSINNSRFGDLITL